jgi:phosphatidylglycerophosphate synthase
LAIAPLEGALIRLRVFPNSVTLASLCLSVIAAVALGMGFFDLGGWLFLLSGILDILDGRVARATLRVSPAGALFDSVLDRYAEFIAYAGLLVYYRDVWVFYAVLALQLGSFMISYSRARGEGLGVAGDVGTMQRPERILLLGCALGGAPFLAHLLEPEATRPFFHLGAVAVTLLAFASNLTAVARLLHIYRALGGDKREPLLEQQGAAPSTTAAEPARPAA